MVIMLDDNIFLSLTCCVRFERKLPTQDTRYGFIENILHNLSNHKFGLIVLKAEEKSTNKILQKQRVYLNDYKHCLKNIG